MRSRSTNLLHPLLRRGSRTRPPAGESGRTVWLSEAVANDQQAKMPQATFPGQKVLVARANVGQPEDP
jgi:hypothetical protein